MVTLPGEGKVPEPACTWDHYKAYEDLGVANNIEFHNKAERVFAELWDFYRCEDGKLEEARAVVNKHCPKLVHNLMHEARPLAVRKYMATQGYKSLDKKAGRRLRLEKDKYMEVTPRWCVDKGECWERIVDYWCSKEYRAKNKDYRNRRAAMLDPPHHQGNLNVMEFGERWASHHNAPLPNLFVSYALAHKAPYRTATPYDENDTASAYSSKTAYDRMEKFKGMAKELKGPEYDVTTEPLDHALVMISGEGRKHGKEAIAGGMFPSSSRSSLPEYKARLGISKSSTCKRSTPAMVEMEARLAELRRVAAEERAEERRLADERTQQAVQQRCSRRCWHKLVNALQCLRLIVPRMVCPL
ncbi:uncharacterized protein [Triticum aestivum]|uniref:uncharacterized protein isoform X2 n=1 Tax=Triticum aestivum TaxID=4565 RepID=UPI001D01DF24|nr:uncharacterized protein LOC123059357 isoform X2 [Triticum aestivum]